MLPTALEIRLAIEPVAMRKEFNGRWALATDRLRENLGRVPRPISPTRTGIGSRYNGLTARTRLWAPPSTRKTFR